MTQTFNAAVSVVGIDIGKNSFHIVGHDERGAIVVRQKWSRGQMEERFATMPRCLVGMEACVGAHHLSRKLNSLGHDARLMPAKYVRPYSKGQKNDFRDAEAIAEAVQRPTMKFVATKTADQLDLQALPRSDWQSCWKGGRWLQDRDDGARRRTHQYRRLLARRACLWPICERSLARWG